MLAIINLFWGLVGMIGLLFTYALWQIGRTDLLLLALSWCIWAQAVVLLVPATLYHFVSKEASHV